MAASRFSGVTQIQAEIEKIESLLKAVTEAFEELKRKVNEIEKSVEDKLSQLSLGEETQPTSSASHEDKYGPYEQPCEWCKRENGYGKIQSMQSSTSAKKWLICPECVEECNRLSDDDNHQSSADDHAAKDNRDLYDSDFESMINPEA